MPDYAVTFEFANRPPQTARGTVKLGTAGKMASLAVREAKKALRPVKPCSFVVVVFLTAVPSASEPAAEG